MSHNQYQSPLTARYASEAMSQLFSPQFKHSTWRRLWVALAKEEQALGLDISQQQIDELEAHIDDIDFARAAELESEFRHDVMAHVHCYGEQCPSARPIIHLGATSCYVTDNSELIQQREGIRLLQGKLKILLAQLADFASDYADLPTLGFTHYQPAQLTTVGKRACLWLQEFLWDLEELQALAERLPFLGVKGTTGTQASFLALFKGNHQKVKELDERVAKRMGFGRLLPVSGQTYSRKLDAMLLDRLAGLGSSAHKFATDLRLLANLKEVEEPFEKQQIGSSAMPYKRNPMRSERICSLARFLIGLAQNPHYTAATQWFERTLDDSANRRLVIAEGFLTADAVLNLLINVTADLVVYPKMIEARLRQELPFMATENLLMQAVSKGGDRQDLHERIRQHSLAASKQIKEHGASNDLLQRLAADSKFAVSIEELERSLDPRLYVGRAPQQVHEFLEAHVFPLLESSETANIEDIEILV